MLGFAIIDHRAASDVVAVWLTNRVSDTSVDHGNAVKVDLDGDTDALRKIHALTRDRLVLLTEGSTAVGLPISDAVLSVDDIALLVAETVALQARILEAIDAYTKRVRTSTLVRPAFDQSVESSMFVPVEDTATHRSLQTANYVARAWGNWLKTDDERRKRSVNPRTKKTPWIMPIELSSPEVSAFPLASIDQFAPQPLKAFSA